MSAPRVMTCPQCGAPVGYGAAFCAFCHSPLEWGGTIPTIDRAEQLVWHDLTHAAPAPAGWPAGEPRADGLLVTVAPGALARGAFGPPIRNACSVIQFTAWDPVDVSLLFRLHVEGSRSDRSVTGYELRIAPAFRAFSLRLTHWEEEDDDDDDPDEPEQKDLYYELTPFETTTIAGPGKPMQVEARYADSVLRLLVGDEIVSTVIDPSFGYGRTAWRVRSVRDDGPARVTIRAAGLFTTR